VNDSLQAAVTSLQVASPKSDSWVSSEFRRYLKRLGFQGVSVCQVEEAAKGRYVCSGMDPMSEKPFCRTYTIAEMRMILHVGCIFWRFIK
jgi:hypothetical protein